MLFGAGRLGLIALKGLRQLGIAEEGVTEWAAWANREGLAAWYAHLEGILAPQRLELLRQLLAIILANRRSVPDVDQSLLVVIQAEEE